MALLSTVDADKDDKHTYQLVEGPGSVDNHLFSINNPSEVDIPEIDGFWGAPTDIFGGIPGDSGDANTIPAELIINHYPDFETKSSYSIRLQTKDSAGQTFEKSFNLTVIDLDEDPSKVTFTPTDISISASSFYENIAGGSAVATLSTTDSDAGDNHAYSLVTGTGDTDNSAFTIDGDQLHINESPDFETNSSYSIRLQTTDSGGLTFEKSFTFNVNDLEDSPSSQLAIPHRKWTQLLGTSDDDYAFSISTSDDGSIYITGSTKGDLDGQTNSGSADAFISKYNSDGSRQWTQLLGTSSHDYAFSISTSDDGSIYITGSTPGDLDGQTNSGSADAFISKYNSDGSRQWTQLLGTSSHDYAFSISTSDDGSIYITGSTPGDLDGQTNSGNTDAFISKYNSDGSRQWTQLLGTSSHDCAFSISISDDGSIYITGYTYGDLDGQTNSGSADAFISKYNSDGSRQWTHLLGTSDYDYASSISISDDESIYITGYTYGDLDGQTNSGSADAFISKYNSDGSRQWTQLLGTSDYDYASSISISDDESIYITGYTSGDLDGQTNSGNTDAFISKYNSDGSRQWTQLLGTSDSDEAEFISISDDESIYITGSTSGDLDGQTNSGSADAFISRFAFNKSPTDISISASSFDENIASGSAVVTLSTSDPDSGDNHTYALVTGTGDTDNASFTIENDKLKIIESPDFETKSSYSVRLQTTDSSGLTFEKSFNLSVNDINDAPTDLYLSSGDTFNDHYVDIDNATSYYGLDSGTFSSVRTVAALSSQDQDHADRHRYKLVKGRGDRDNHKFKIDGENLMIREVPTSEDSTTIYRIRIRTIDLDGGRYRKKIKLYLRPLPEPCACLPPQDPTPINSESIDPEPIDPPESGNPAPGDPGPAPGPPGGAPIEPDPDPGPPGGANPAPIPIDPGPGPGPINPGVQSINNLPMVDEISNYELREAVIIRNQVVSNIILGTSKKDIITGTQDAEILVGCLNKDQLEGKGGGDGFLFHKRDDFGKSKKDNIVDFDPTEGDSILIDGDVYGVSSAFDFEAVENKKSAKQVAKTSVDFIYNEKNGNLYFNENGASKGWGDGGFFAKLIGAPELGASDFTIV
ncbi:SBBP repeat-containing protein [Synechococcus sp. M16CYN]|uniref:SBBP repeat-containing protein n=1 Tax=Synechococcus sp. M16CYN TaxID=3103139 RepID=UPI0033405CF4